MRRAILSLVVGGVLLVAAACDSTPTTTPGGPPGPGQAAAQASMADTRAMCENIGKVYGTNVGALASALGKLIGSPGPTGDGAKTAKAQAQQALGSFADAIRTATQESHDPQVRSDGQQAADQLRSKASDAKLFDGIKTSNDLNTLIGPTLKDWLAPVMKHCS
jgi:hypothetical protein